MLCLELCTSWALIRSEGVFTPIDSQPHVLTCNAMHNTEPDALVVCQPPVFGAESELCQEDDADNQRGPLAGSSLHSTSLRPDSTTHRPYQQSNQATEKLSIQSLPMPDDSSLPDACQLDHQRLLNADETKDFDVHPVCLIRIVQSHVKMPNHVCHEQSQLSIS
jgi:hypothetical protein